jgi:hypothetical protein
MDGTIKYSTPYEMEFFVQVVLSITTAGIRKEEGRHRKRLIT